MKCDKIFEIILKQKSGLFTENCHNIIYCKASAKHSTMFLKDNNDSNSIPKCLKHVEERLPSECFVRVHHNCVVNLNYIKEFDNIQNIILLKNGTELSVSSGKKYRLKKMLKKKFTLI